MRRALNLSQINITKNKIKEFTQNFKKKKKNISPVIIDNIFMSEQLKKIIKN